MALETNLNQSPYFDDFDETKNYNRILFRPGFAVQARELTQLQTILQNQIERFGNEILVDGTIVTGTALKIEDIDFVKLRDKDANNRVLLLTDFFSGGVVANATVTGTTSGTGFIAAKTVAEKGARTLLLNRKTNRSKKSYDLLKDISLGNDGDFQNKRFVDIKKNTKNKIYFLNKNKSKAVEFYDAVKELGEKCEK